MSDNIQQQTSLLEAPSYTDNENESLSYGNGNKPLPAPPTWTQISEDPSYGELNNEDKAKSLTNWSVYAKKYFDQKKLLDDPKKRDAFYNRINNEYNRLGYQSSDAYKQSEGLLPAATRGFENSVAGLSEAVGNIFPAGFTEGLSELSNTLYPNSSFSKKLKNFNDAVYNATAGAAHQFIESNQPDRVREKSNFLSKTGESLGSFMPDLGAAALTEGTGLVSRLKYVDQLPKMAGSIVETAKSLLPGLLESAKNFTLPALRSAMDAQNSVKNRGGDELQQLQASILSAAQTLGGAAIPMNVTSELANPVYRFASRAAQTVPLAIGQQEAMRSTNNILNYLTNSPLGQQPFSLQDTIANAVPMSLLGGVMGHDANTTKIIHDGINLTTSLLAKGAPDTAKAVAEQTAQKAADSITDGIPKEDYHGPFQEEIKEGKPISLDQVMHSYLELPRGYSYDEDSNSFIYNEESPVKNAGVADVPNSGHKIIFQGDQGILPLDLENKNQQELDFNNPEINGKPSEDTGYKDQLFYQDDQGISPLSAENKNQQKFDFENKSEKLPIQETPIVPIEETPPAVDSEIPKDISYKEVLNKPTPPEILKEPDITSQTPVENAEPNLESNEVPNQSFIIPQDENNIFIRSLNTNEKNNSTLRKKSLSVIPNKEGYVVKYRTTPAKGFYYSKEKSSPLLVNTENKNSENRVRLKTTPQPYTILEKLPQTKVEKNNEEQFYRVKNERTGHEQTVEEKDMTPIRDSIKVSKKVKSLPDSQQEKAASVTENDESEDPYNGKFLPYKRKPTIKQKLSLIDDISRLGIFDSNPNSKDILQKISSNNNNEPWLRDIASRLGKIKNDSPITFDVSNRPDSRWSALYIHPGKIIINSDSYIPHLDRIITHEILHHFTLYKISHPENLSGIEKDAYNGLNEIYNKIKSDPNLKDEYGITHGLKEMVAEALTNSSFRSKLESLHEGSKTVWDKILNFISRILFNNKSKEGSMLDEIVERTMNLAGENVVEERFKSDLKYQAQEIERVAKREGYSGIDDLYQKNPERFNELAKSWREDHPNRDGIAASYPEHEDESIFHKGASDSSIVKGISDLSDKVEYYDKSLSGIKELTQKERDLITPDIVKYGELLAHKFQNISSSYKENVYSAANLALLKAVKSYDPNRGASFKSWVYKIVTNDLKKLYFASTKENLKKTSMDSSIGEQDRNYHDIIPEKRNDIKNLESSEIREKLKKSLNDFINNIPELNKNPKDAERDANIFRDALKGQALSGLEIAKKYGMSRFGVLKAVRKYIPELKKVLSENGLSDFSDIFSEPREKVFESQPVNKKQITDEEEYNPNEVGRLESEYEKNPKEPTVVNEEGNSDEDNNIVSASISEDLKETPLYYQIKKTAKKLDTFRKDLKNLFLRNKTKDILSYTSDAAENKSGVFANNSANDIREILKKNFGVKYDKKAEEALSFVVEAQNNKQELNDFRKKILSNPEYSPYKHKALEAIDFAENNFDKLIEAANAYEKMTSSMVFLENQVTNKNNPTPKFPGYVMHVQDVDAKDPMSFDSLRSHRTFADSIKNKVDPKSLNAVDLLHKRIMMGMQKVNYSTWIYSMRDIIDPIANKPIVSNLEKIKREDGSTVEQVPKGYSTKRVGGRDVAVLNGYENILGSLTDKSAIRQSSLGQGALKVNAVGKSLALLGDVMHLSRLALWQSVIKSSGLLTNRPDTTRLPVPSYAKGLMALDYQANTLKGMVERGEIKRDDYNKISDLKKFVKLQLDTGFNVGKIHDAVDYDWVHHLPGVGKFTSWLFDKFQRGAMQEAWVLEFERMKSMGKYKTMDDHSVARLVSKDLNTRFGNLGKQGVLKNKTYRDLSQLAFLAPGWNMGLITSELGSIAQMGESIKDVAQGKGFALPTLARVTGMMFAGNFIANQVINYVTRGQPTWENPEEGFGSKMSAWIPDLIGNGPGFFLNPFSLPFETFHILMKKYEETKGNAWERGGKALKDYLRSRTSYLSNLSLTGLTNTNRMNMHILPQDEVNTLTSASIPSPIFGESLYLGGKQLATGENQEKFQGQFGKQILATMGLRTDQAPSPLQRMYRLASDFNSANGVSANAEFYGGDYTKINQAITIGNESDSKYYMKELLNKKTPEQIIKYYQKWYKTPFTKRTSTEKQFFNSLNPEQQQSYEEALRERFQIAQKAKSLLNDVIQEKDQPQ